MNLKFKTFLLLCLSFCMGAAAQTMKERKSNLERIVQESKESHAFQAQKVKNYARKHNVPISYVDYKGNNVLLIGIDEFGLPIYQTTLNEESSVSTGVTQLRTGGRVGVNLQGQGIVVGVWDGGKVKDHTEFKDRLNTVQGTDFSSHATHVTGTIIAEGKTANAKGMAPKAIASTWDFDNDETEIAGLARPDQTSLLLSNHSYGIAMGWLYNGTAWSWSGNSSISSSEDYRFGFYAAKSRTLDQIAFNAPYYTMVWASGNDRQDVGTGTFPPDGNGGTGYDCLGQEGVAKNVITVGAVERVLNYTGATSVKMAGFSSWGPTDDGRIKPDLVGVGVNVFSTNVGAGNTDSYKNDSGTSMAAPNVTGSFVLLQELFKNLHAGNYMKAATLRALAIHTTKEAGDFPGPDYSFGWGLLDVEAAAQLLLTEDQKTVLVTENTLLNGQVIEFQIEPKAGAKITATIAWTDPPGTPVSPALDPQKRMLVNDLDIRLIDDANVQAFPWTLDPGNPSLPATKNKDNDRDNIEKIEFDSPLQKTYKIRVSHKGQLVNGKQDFSLILKYTPLNNPIETFYWIGDTGDWSNPANWSLTSGGAPANQVPGVNGHAIFNENSFVGSGDVVTLTANADCASLTWMAKNNSSLSLNGNKLQVNGNLISSFSEFSIASSGTIEFLSTGSVSRQINIGSNDFSKATLIINSDSTVTWTVSGEINVGTIDLQKGKLIAKNAILKLNKLVSNSSTNRTLDLSGAKINDLTESTIAASKLQWLTGNLAIKLKSLETSLINWSGVQYKGSLEVAGGQANFTGNATVHEIILDGDLELKGNNTIEKITATGGSAIHLQPLSKQTFTNDITLNSISTKRIVVSTAGVGVSELAFEGHFKKCFNFIDVSNVNLNLVGGATVSAGANSTLSNSLNWASGACGNALYANFSFNYNCKGAMTEFTNSSEGNITSYTWDFGDPLSASNVSNEQNSKHIYTNSGMHTVKLTVNDGTTTKSYSKQLEVVANDLEPNKVILANEKLFSYLTAEGYQWFRNDIKLTGATSRSLEFGSDAGSYYVITKSSACNIPSSVFVIAETQDHEIEAIERNVLIFPNPARDEVSIKMPLELLPAKISLVNSLGQSIFSAHLTTAAENKVALKELPDGLYLLEIKSKTSLRKKLIIKH